MDSIDYILVEYYMNYIKCPKCGKEEPAFDYAHVCGPIEVKRTVMNERIKELAEKADIVFGHYNNNEVICSAIDIEKFAKLIIEECARVARETPAPNFHEYLKQQLGHTWDMAASEAGREIVKHFGVEE
jgi:hypothetical protein